MSQVVNQQLKCSKIEISAQDKKPIAWSTKLAIGYFKEVDTVIVQNKHESFQ